MSPWLRIAGAISIILGLFIGLMWWKIPGARDGSLFAWALGAIVFLPLIWAMFGHFVCLLFGIDLIDIKQKWKDER